MRLLLNSLLSLSLLIALPAQAREVLPLNRGWWFSKGLDPLSEGQLVHLPHTWNAADGESPSYYRGDALYRKRFRLPTPLRHQHVFIRFEGVNQVCQVYLNGRKMGEHQGGFTGFVVELTNALYAEGENELMVHVNNAPHPDVAPLDGDFTSFGGIYRRVELVATGEAHIDLMDHGGPGVYVQPLSINRARAELKAKVYFTGARAGQLRLTVRDHQGQVVFRSLTPVRSPGVIEQPVLLSSPHLWDAKVDPYLYRFEAERLSEEGEVLDAVSIPLGLRSFKVDPEFGFSLNDHAYDLHGVNLHQDWAGEGWALSDRERRINLRFLNEIGATAVRLSHYPHAADTLDRLDRAGIVAWAEIPLINQIGPSQAFRQNVRTQLTELIAQQSMHPSILFWGLYNEVPKDPTGLVPELNQLAHALDPSRLTTAAVAINGDLQDPIVSQTDLLGLNRYYGWYYGALGDLGPALDRAHFSQKSRPFAVSEYGAGASPEQHQGTGTEPSHAGDFHPMEWQSLFHESTSALIQARPYLWGSFVWNLFDFAAAHRAEGPVHGINDKGLVSYDRTQRKDAFYYYKALWNSRTPVIHVNSSGWFERPCGGAALKVYSNLSELILKVNGKNQGGPIRPSDHVVFVWPNVALKAGGPNQIEISGPTNGLSFSEHLALICAP